jgi:hypothetical protein
MKNLELTGRTFDQMDVQKEIARLHAARVRKIPAAETKLPAGSANSLPCGAGNLPQATAAIA